MEQTPPAIGRISARQSSHTGNREMFVRGAPQNLQSDGKNVLKRDAAKLLNPETNVEANEHFAASSLDPSSRVGMPLLLKTVLPRPDAAIGAPPGRSSSV